MPATAEAVEHIAFLVVLVVQVEVAEEHRRRAAVLLRLALEEARRLLQLLPTGPLDLFVLRGADKGLEVRRSHHDLAHALPCRTREQEAAPHSGRAELHEARTDRAAQGGAHCQRDVVCLLAVVAQSLLLLKDLMVARLPEKRAQHPHVARRHLLHREHGGAG